MPRRWKGVTKEQAERIKREVGDPKDYVKQIGERFYAWVDPFTPIPEPTPENPEAMEKHLQDLAEKGYLDKDQLKKELFVPTARGELYFAQADKSTEVQGDQVGEKIGKMISDLSPEELKRILDNEKKEDEAK